MAAVAAAAVCSALLAGPSPAQAGTQRPVGAHPAALGGTWGKAEEVPGIAALNRGRSATINSVSCGSAGDCSAVGVYIDRSGIQQQAFVVNEVNGVWGKAEEMPGTAALNTGGSAFPTSVSCASAGNCSAVGSYGSTNSPDQFFAADEVKGVWETAKRIAGIPARKIETVGNPSVSCASKGNCSAVGNYFSLTSGDQVFAADEVKGVWETASKLSIPAVAHKSELGISSVSCGSAGNCSAVGNYTDRSGQQAFVVNEVKGAWGKVEEMRGSAAGNSVSCGSAGNCSAVGDYTTSSGDGVFVADEVKGVWGKAKQITGTAALSKGKFDTIFSVSCASAGNCSAGGVYTDGSGFRRVFVVDEVQGVWGKAEQVPGTPGLNSSDIGLTSVSCGSAGNCSAVGFFLDNSGRQAFVADEVKGVWETAKEVPGLAALNQGGAADIPSVSCASAGNCSAGGDYIDRSGSGQAFVVSEAKRT
jgi:hypothetical protein